MYKLHCLYNDVRTSRLIEIFRRRGPSIIDGESSTAGDATERTHKGGTVDDLNSLCIFGTISEKAMDAQFGRWAQANYFEVPTEIENLKRELSNNLDVCGFVVLMTNQLVMTYCY